tara:strand:- start:64 stop:324 length:261 start_codon:yes stop_codon:yes gene_type:complete
MKVTYGDKKWATFCEVDEVELDVMIFYNTSPAEREVNWAGGLDITGVYFEDEGCMLESMSPEEIDALEERVIEHENESHDSDNQDY